MDTDPNNFQPISVLPTVRIFLTKLEVYRCKKGLSQNHYGLRRRGIRSKGFGTAEKAKNGVCDNHDLFELLPK